MKTLLVGVKEDQLVRFRIHGVDAEFIRDVKAAGYPNMTPEDLVDMRLHGRRWLRKGQ